jgi:hypothetical protein
MNITCLGELLVDMFRPRRPAHRRGQRVTPVPGGAGERSRSSRQARSRSALLARWRRGFRAPPSEVLGGRVTCVASVSILRRTTLAFIAKPDQTTPSSCSTATQGRIRLRADELDRGLLRSTRAHFGLPAFRGTDTQRDVKPLYCPGRRIDLRCQLQAHLARPREAYEQATAMLRMDRSS